MTYDEKRRTTPEVVHEELDSMSTGQKGAWAELVASTDLMNRGYYVFRALSPHCPCDLVALKGGRTLRVEVTMGQSTETGYTWSRHNPSKYDLLAVVFKNGQIVYNPSIDKDISDLD